MYTSGSCPHHHLLPFLKQKPSFRHQDALRVRPQQVHHQRIVIGIGFHEAIGILNLLPVDGLEFEDIDSLIPIIPKIKQHLIFLIM